MAEQFFSDQKTTSQTKPGANAMSLQDYFSVDTGLNKSLGENLEKFIEKFEERLGSGTKVLVLKSPSLRAPAVFAVKEGRAFGHLIEAGITKPLTTRLSNQNGRMVERAETAADIVDERFVKVATEFLNKSISGAVKIVGVSVVPKSADILNDNVIGYCVAYANLALLNTGAKLTAKAITDSDFRLVNSFQFTPDGNTLNPFGVPLATDFKIQTSARKKSSKGNNSITSSPNEDSDQLVLSNVSGRVDAFYQPKNRFLGQSNNVLFGAQQMPEPGYIGLVVLNDINGLSEDGRGRETLMTQLIGIASAARLAANQNFQRVWQPTPGENNTKENPGLVALEHNVFNDMNYEPQELTVHHGVGKMKDNEMGLTQLVQSYFHKTALIVLECESNSPNSFIQNKFVKAAKGDSAAMKEIVDELNLFTKDEFGKIFNTETQSIAAIKPVVTHSGYYLSDDNQTRIDISSVDHMRKLRAYGTEPSAMYTLTPSPDKNSFEQLFKRSELLQRIAPSFRQTGWKSQVFFNPKFIQAIIKAFDNAGLRMGTENLESQDNGFMQTSILDSVLGDLNTGMELGDLFSDSVLDAAGNSILDTDMLDLSGSIL